MIRRDIDAITLESGFDGGRFRVPSVEPGWWLIFIASWGMGWDHVSVRAVSDRSGKSRIPSWKEMCQIRHLCWPPDDCVMQLHPPDDDYVNLHPCVLHLWRPQDAAIPMPPKVCV